LHGTGASTLMIGTGKRRGRSGETQQTRFVSSPRIKAKTRAKRLKIRSAGSRGANGNGKGREKKSSHTVSSLRIEGRNAASSAIDREQFSLSSLFAHTPGPDGKKGGGRNSD